MRLGDFTYKVIDLETTLSSAILANKYGDGTLDKSLFGWGCPGRRFGRGLPTMTVTRRSRANAVNHTGTGGGDRALQICGWL